MKQRNESLDALRGFAILAMVLSGSIAFGGVLPAWMYHAQVPPPAHKFIPTVPGITWVDLVFPFFLFSMGAAIPLSLAKYMQEARGFLPVLLVALRRYILLTFFAIFIFHMRAWVISDTPANTEYLLSILAFVLLFFQFYDDKKEHNKKLFHVIKIVAFIIGILLLYLLPFGEKGFSLKRSDIIIIVLANMAFLGTLIWWLTRNNVIVRLGILPLIMAVFLGGKEVGTWNETLFNFSPIPWMYSFYYLKYLFIIIPGTLAGEWLLQAANKTVSVERTNRASLYGISLLSFLLIITNTGFLFARYLIFNLMITAAIGAVIYYLLQKVDEKDRRLLLRFFNAGFYLLLLGLFFDAYEGGIKKDPSTYSYYFVTSGLAFFMLIGFYRLQEMKVGKVITHYLSLNGRNPMVAYVAGSLLVTPILHLIGLIDLFNKMNTNALIGFLKGFLFTAIVSLLTIFFTKRKWFWKT